MIGEPASRPGRPRRRRRPRRGRRAPRGPGAARRARLHPALRATLLALGGFGVVLALGAGALGGWASLGTGGARYVRVEVPERATASALAGLLQQAGLLEHPRLFALHLRVFGDAARVVPGPHLLAQGASPRTLIALLERAGSRPSARVTLPEGWNHVQIAARMEQLGICPASELELAVRDRRLLDALDVRGPNAEGFLFPATYELRLDTDARDVVRRLAGETRARLSKLAARHAEGRRRLEARGWRDEQILALASIVEKESARPEDRRRIAGVFLNRLDDPEFRPARALASDTTAAYGCVVARDDAPSCAAYAGSVTPEMLRDGANRYNTYAHPGLPPGPIANPGEDAIAAVLEPARHGYLFFVSTGAGATSFSRSYEEHQAKVHGKK